MLTERAATRPSSRWTRRLWALVKLAGLVGLALVAVDVAVSHRDELSGARAYLDDVRLHWVVLAALAEAVSLLCFTSLQRRLLAAGGLDVGLGPLVAITLAGNAMANSLPGGGAFATVFAFRQFRRKGADEALATWTLLAVTGLTAVTLAVLAGIGLALAGSQVPVSGLAPLILLLLVGPLVGVAVLLRPQLLGRPATALVAGVQRVSGWPKTPARHVVDHAIRRLQAVTPRLHDWLVSLLWAAGNWLGDCACLVASFLAVGAPVPTRGLLLAYGAAQVAVNLPITPGGLGVVEGSLTVALVAFGGSTSATVAAVLLYRLLSFWVLLPVGWTSWGALTVQARRRRGKEGGT